MLKKLPLFLIIISLTSCAQNSCKWVYDYADQTSSRLVHAPNNPFSGMELEFMRIEEDIFAYIKIHSGKIRTSNEKLAAIKITFRDQEIQGFGDVLDGGQKMTLHKNIRESILFALRNDLNVTVSVDGYEETFDAEQFDDLYKKLQFGRSFGWKNLLPNAKLPEM